MSHGVGGLAKAALAQVGGDNMVHSHPVVFLEGPLPGLEGSSWVVQVMLVDLT